MVKIEQVTLVAAVVAIVKAVKMYVPAITEIWTVLLAALIGAVAGYFHYQGLDILSGVLIGLSAVGVVTTADRIANK